LLTSHELEVDLGAGVDQVGDSALDLAQTLIQDHQQVLEVAGRELLSKINVHGLELVKEGGWVEATSNVERDASHVLGLGADNCTLLHALGPGVSGISLHLRHCTFVDIAETLGPRESRSLKAGRGEMEAVLDVSEGGILSGGEGVGKARDDSCKHGFSFRFEI